MASANGSDVETSPSDEGSVGGSGAAVVGGVIFAMIVVLVCLLVVIMRYMYRNKGTYQTNEAKGTEHAESADEALRNDPSLLGDMDVSKKEYFI
ncbi:glycophorin-C-like [Lissotriton helveticus]